MKHYTFLNSKKTWCGIASIGFIVLALTSCKKKSEDTTEKTVGFSAPTIIAIKGSTTPLYTLDYTIAQTTTTIPITVIYSQTEAPQDIAISLGLGDEATITQYNTEQKKSYVPMDPALYSISASSIVIPKGKNTATFDIVVRTSAFDLNKKYALPLKIKNSSFGTINKSSGQLLLNIGAKNDYDGIYRSIEGTVTRYASPGVPANDGLSGSMASGQNITLSVIDANTVRVANLRWAGDNAGTIDIENLQLVVDAATKQVTVKALDNPSLKNTSGKDNKYDPATKTFTLNFDWNQTTTPREIKGLLLKYAGARP